MKIVLLAGGPGSGKSTQGAELMKRCSNIMHLSLGEVVRGVLRNPEHPLAIKYQSAVTGGQLLPDSVILDILKQALAKIKVPNTVVLLDGYPRTPQQYADFKKNWGLPDALIHLDVSAGVLNARLNNRHTGRSDDNNQAVAQRLDFYHSTTLPLIEEIKQDLNKAAITAKDGDSITATSIYLFSQLHRIPTIHQAMRLEPGEPEAVNDRGEVKAVWPHSILLQMWQSGSAFQAVDCIQQSYLTNNFSFSIMGRKIVYLETAEEVKAVLGARTSLGPVYRQFSLAAGLKYDFVATDSHDKDKYHLPNNQINVWKLVHTALGAALKEDHVRMEELMDKHLDDTFFAEKTFDLDVTFDRFFCGFWSDYLFGPKVAVASYMENRESLFQAMKHCFYSSRYKGIDPTGLSSWLYSYPVSDDIHRAKVKIKLFIKQATPGSLVHHFIEALQLINVTQELGLSADLIDEIAADNVFDLMFKPDFLENVMYETLVNVVQENVDLREGIERDRVYLKGLHQGYLFPVRSRVLEEQVALRDGTQLPVGSYVYLNLKQAGVYHSAGPRLCIGIAFTKYFKDHFFKRLEAVEFKVKNVTQPQERLIRSTDENIPTSAERYQVSWHLRRDGAKHQLDCHNYKGQRFFEVLKFQRQPPLNAFIVRQCVHKIEHLLTKQKINKRDVVIATAELRGVPTATSVAGELRLPLFIIRKKGGNKMLPEQVYAEKYSKGYQDSDEVELPLGQVKELAGKQIIFIDDGIASGHSAMACIELLEKTAQTAGETTDEPKKGSARVAMVLTLLKHDYVETDPRLFANRTVKTLFDCHGGPFEPRDAVSLSATTGL